MQKKKFKLTTGLVPASLLIFILYEVYKSLIIEWRKIKEELNKHTKRVRKSILIQFTNAGPIPARTLSKIKG